MDTRTGTQTWSWILIVSAIKFAVVSWVTAAFGDGRGSGHVPSVILNIDALGLVDSWSAREPLAKGRSSAQMIGMRRSLLFSCRRARSLYLTVEERQARMEAYLCASFGCAPGEALFAVAGHRRCQACHR